MKTSKTYLLRTVIFIILIFIILPICYGQKVKYKSFEKAFKSPEKVIILSMNGFMTGKEN